MAIRCDHIFRPVLNEYVVYYNRHRAHSTHVSHPLVKRSAGAPGEGGALDPRGAGSGSAARRAPGGEKTPPAPVHRALQPRGGEKSGLALGPGIPDPARGLPLEPHPDPHPLPEGTRVVSNPVLGGLHHTHLPARKGCPSRARKTAITKEERVRRAKLRAGEPAQAAKRAGEASHAFFLRPSPPSSLPSTSGVVVLGRVRAFRIGRIRFLAEHRCE